MKTCSKCGGDKGFYRHSARKDGLQLLCKPCGNHASRKYQLGKYGLTHDDYQTLWDDQNGLCAICEQPETTSRKGKLQLLSVDHCHTTGGVRGLLCRNCNLAIGLLGDNIKLLSTAMTYLLQAEKVQQ